MNIDLTALTVFQLACVLVVVAAIDTLSGIVGAIQAKTFTVSVLADYLESHVLKRVFPILGLAFIGQTLGGPNGAGAAIWATALLSLAAYIAETVASVSGNLSPPA
jgi:small basic protein